MSVVCLLIECSDAQVNCFIVRKGAKGLRTEKIQNKIALRCVQNAGTLPAALLLCIFLFVGCVPLHAD